MDGKKILQLSEATVDQVKDGGYTVVSVPGQSHKVSVNDLTNYDNLVNTPDIGSAASLDVAASGDASTEQVVKGDDSRLTDARTPKSHTHGNISNEGKSTSEPTNTTKFLRADGNWEMPGSSRASVADAVAPSGPIMSGNVGGYIKLATVTFPNNDAMYVGVNATVFWRQGDNGTGTGRMVILPLEYERDTWKGFVHVDALRGSDVAQISIQFGFVVNRSAKTLEIWCAKGNTYHFAYCDINAAAGSTVACEPTLNVVPTEPSGIKWLSYLGSGLDMSFAGRSQYCEYTASKIMQIKIPITNYKTSTIDFSCSLISTYWCYPFHVVVAGRIVNGQWNTSQAPSLAVLGSNNNSNGSYIPVMTYGSDANNVYIFLTWSNTVRLFCTYSALNNRDNKYNNMDISISTISSFPVSQTVGAKRYGNVHTLNYGTAVGSTNTPVYVDGEGCVRQITAAIPATLGGTGKTSLNAACNAMINSLPEGTDPPTDNDYIVAQYAGGGTSNTNYYRRKLSKFWDWAKTKVSSLITNAINALDVNEVGGSGKVIQSIKEVDGKISAVAVSSSALSVAAKNITYSSGSFTPYSGSGTANIYVAPTVIIQWKPSNLSTEPEWYRNIRFICEQAFANEPLKSMYGSGGPAFMKGILMNTGTKTATVSGFYGASWSDLPVGRFMCFLKIGTSSGGTYYREDN